MSRYTLIGDPHITHKSLDRAAQLFELVEAVGLPAIWLGDLLDTKEVIRGKCLNAAIEYFRTSKLRHIILIGNHDWFNLECLAHSLEALKLLPNVVVIDKPTQIDDLTFLPYIHDKEILSQELANFCDENRTLIAHLEITNFDFGNGHLCPGGLPLTALSGFKRVISGHFHKFQQSENLTYLGTPFSHSFGESNQTKYIGMLDTETNELKLAETPFPKHFTIEIDCDSSDISYTALVGDEDCVNNFYRVILTGTQVNIDKFQRCVFDKLNVKWIERPSDDSVNDVSIDETVSNETQFSKWATDIRKMDEETLKLGLSILEACK